MPLKLWSTAFHSNSPIPVGRTALTHPLLSALTLPPLSALPLPPVDPVFFVPTFSLLLLAFVSHTTERTAFSDSHAYSRTLSTDASTSTIAQAEAPGGAYGLDTSPTARRSSDPACVCRDRHKIFELRAQKAAWSVVTTSIGVPNHFLPEIAKTRALSNTWSTTYFCQNVFTCLFPNRQIYNASPNNSKIPPLGKNERGTLTQNCEQIIWFRYQFDWLNHSDYSHPSLPLSRWHDGNVTHHHRGHYRLRADLGDR